MKVILFAALIVGLLAGPVLAQPTPPDPAILAYKLPGQIPWKGDPKTGPLSYVLWGDPTKPGPYALLARWPAHQMSRPHTHPNARYITVVSGTWWVGTGRTYAPETTFPIPAGSTVTHAAGQWHYDGAKDGDVILEIVGEGPQ